jgi:tetratricopeptide (TPR) repeat protein
MIWNYNLLCELYNRLFEWHQTFEPFNVFRVSLLIEFPAILLRNMLEHDLASALKCYEEGLAVSRRIGDDFAIATSLDCLGALSVSNGKISAARDFWQEALTIYGKLGNQEAISNCSNNLGAIAVEAGNDKEANFRFSEGMEIASRLGYKINLADSLNGFAVLAARRKDIKTAANLSGAAENIRQSIGYAEEPFEKRNFDEYITQVGAHSMKKPTRSPTGRDAR